MSNPFRYAMGERTPPFPSPLPSPRGEGERDAVCMLISGCNDYPAFVGTTNTGNNIARQRPFRSARMLFPLLWGEGQGEGERGSRLAAAPGHVQTEDLREGCPS